MHLDVGVPVAALLPCMLSSRLRVGCLSHSCCVMFTAIRQQLVQYLEVGVSLAALLLCMLCSRLRVGCSPQGLPVALVSCCLRSGSVCLLALACKACFALQGRLLPPAGLLPAIALGELLLKTHSNGFSLCRRRQLHCQHACEQAHR